MSSLPGIVGTPTPPRPSSSTSHFARIQSVDGLRAVAVLGVLWWHAWIHTENPRAMVAVGDHHFDLQRTIALLGNGVDLFFVISGFCIFLALRRFDWNRPIRAYAQFVGRRWLRLSPAFYTACLFCAAIFTLVAGFVPVKALVLHAFWLPAVRLDLAAPFWSLQTEWEFYLITPFLLLAGRKIGTATAIITAGILCLGLRFWTLSQAESIHSSALAHLPCRFIEFGWGMLAVIVIERQHGVLRVVKGARGIILGLFFAYLGRLMMTTEAAAYFPACGVVIKTLAEPLMTLGFACLLVCVVVSESSVRRMLESTALQKVGRWSYSLYLLHWWPSILIAQWVMTRMGRSVAAHYTTLALLILVLIPLAAALYHFTEQPFLRGVPGKSKPPRGGAEAPRP